MSTITGQLDDSLTIPYALYRKSQRVGACVSLEDVRTHNIEADLQDFGSPGPMRPELSVDIQITPPMDSGAFIVAVQYALTLLRHEDSLESDDEEKHGAEEVNDEESVVAKISVGIAGLYQSDGLPSDIEEDELEAFGRSAAALALHAYARELISSTTQRFGLPQLLLPPMRVISDVPMD